MYTAKIEVINKFPEILSNANCKSDIESAAKKVVFDREKPNGHKDSDCWLLWLTITAACATVCGDDIDCSFECFNVLSLNVTICFLTAD